MKAGLTGLGCVTPLGTSLEALVAGEAAPVQTIRNPETGREHRCRPVPPACVAQLGRHPRLRRASALSLFAVAAAQAALAEAGPSPRNTAVVFAVSDGGVIYTRRFYDQIVKQGASVASPLLFPETVYNAPASHLAAILGLEDASYTLVGDDTVGLAALHFGAQLLALGQCDRAVVVGCEEIDWILCEAYHDWRLARAPLAEGAGAIVLERTGPLVIETSPGVPFTRRVEAADALRAALSGKSAAYAVPSLASLLGEAPGASALWQVIAGALALQRSEYPSALIARTGFNQQAAAAVLHRVG
jgi:3-oxoacyl-(acyl-carrier-protein) synthase